MKLIQRLKNLWKLSEWEPSNTQIEELHQSGRSFAPLTKAPRQAQIIKRDSPIKRILQEDEE